MPVYAGATQLAQIYQGDAEVAVYVGDSLIQARYVPPALPYRDSHASYTNTSIDLDAGTVGNDDFRSPTGITSWGGTLYVRNRNVVNTYLAYSDTAALNTSITLAGVSDGGSVTNAVIIGGKWYRLSRLTVAPNTWRLHRYALDGTSEATMTTGIPSTVTAVQGIDATSSHVYALPAFGGPMYRIDVADGITEAVVPTGALGGAGSHRGWTVVPATPTAHNGGVIYYRVSGPPHTIREFSAGPVNGEEASLINAEYYPRAMCHIGGDAGLLAVVTASASQATIEKYILNDLTFS